MPAKSAPGRSVAAGPGSTVARLAERPLPAEPKPSDRHRRKARSSWWAWGAALGVSAALPTLVSFLTLARVGWAPTWDEAVMAWRSYDMLDGHVALLGMYTRASNAVAGDIYHPGPALFWVLAVPTRLAPGAGPLVGAGALVLLTLVVTCLAAARLGGVRAAVLAAAAALVLTVSMADQMLGLPVWNPWMGFLPFASALVVGATVAAGRLGWWPLLVVLASVALQAHLMYAAAPAVAIVAPMVGVAAARRQGWRPGWRWLAIGTTLGLAMWAAPLWQQLTHSPGNLGLLGRATLLDPRPKLGLSSAVPQFGAVVAAAPFPLWGRPPQASGFADTFTGSAAVGRATLVLLAALVLLAWYRRRHTQAALGLVTLIAALASIKILADIAQAQAFTVVYIRYVLFPVGMLVWVVAGLAGMDAVLLLRHRTHSPSDHATSLLAEWQSHLPPRSLGAAVFLVAVVGVSAWAARAAPGFAGLDGGDRTRELTVSRQASSLLGPPPHPGARVALASFAQPNLGPAFELYALGYELRARGWDPIIANPAYPLLDPYYRQVRRTDPVLDAVTGSPVPPGGRRLGQIVIEGSVKAVWLGPPQSPLTH